MGSGSAKRAPNHGMVDSRVSNVTSKPQYHRGTEKAGSQRDVTRRDGVTWYLNSAICLVPSGRQVLELFGGCGPPGGGAQGPKWGARQIFPLPRWGPT